MPIEAGEVQLGQRTCTITFTGDVTQQSDIDLSAALGSRHIVVNCAGVVAQDDPADVEDATWERMLLINHGYHSRVPCRLAPTPSGGWECRRQCGLGGGFQLHARQRQQGRSGGLYPQHRAPTRPRPHPRELTVSRLDTHLNS